jgi:hypothetical protein
MRILLHLTLCKTETAPLRPIYINVDQIICFYPRNGKETVIELTGNGDSRRANRATVTETPEEIVDMLRQMPPQPSDNTNISGEDRFKVLLLE